MAQNTTSRKRNQVVAAADPEQPVGKNLYFDKKRRMIYTSPMLREALYLPKYDYKRFNRYKSRYIITAATFMILATSLNEWFEMPLWVSLVATLLVFAGIELSFYKFQKTLTVVKDFGKANATSTIDNEISSDMRTKCWIKIVLYVILGVLIVVNAYQSHYSNLIIGLCWAALVLFLYMAFDLLRTLMRSPKL